MEDPRCGPHGRPRAYVYRQFQEDRSILREVMLPYREVVGVRQRRTVDSRTRHLLSLENSEFSYTVGTVSFAFYTRTVISREA